MLPKMESGTDPNETKEAPRAIKGVDKETVHRICSGQVSPFHKHFNIALFFSLFSFIFLKFMIFCHDIFVLSGFLLGGSRLSSF
jgi:hypothetical protein